MTSRRQLSSGHARNSSEDTKVYGVPEVITAPLSVVVGVLIDVVERGIGDTVSVSIEVTVRLPLVWLVSLVPDVASWVLEALDDVLEERGGRELVVDSELELT
jgi:hypothetical protein